MHRFLPHIAVTETKNYTKYPIYKQNGKTCRRKIVLLP